MGRQKILKIEELPDLLSPQQAADYLTVSRGFVYQLCQRTEETGGLKSFTVGTKSRKIMKRDLVDWIEKQRCGVT